ncbi:hypothetical protein ACRQ5Q_12165 [Bradyrhizobium sp. PMVTL-01]|uniref:hypothetical protein n=1 Tax=unclassified Bradyrhizobium TaxID=2631580 RepID=UPI003F72D2EB
MGLFARDNAKASSAAWTSTSGMDVRAAHGLLTAVAAHVNQVKDFAYDIATIAHSST